MKWLVGFLSGSMDTKKMRALGQALIAAADLKDAKQAALDKAFDSITKAVDDLKKA